MAGKLQLCYVKPLETCWLRGLKCHVNYKQSLLNRVRVPPRAEQTGSFDSFCGLPYEKQGLSSSVDYTEAFIPPKCITG